MKRLKILFQGIVQGVGFRPFLYRNAQKFHLTGFVNNTPKGVILEVQGEEVDEFVHHILNNPPPLSHIKSYSIEEIPVVASDTFEIIPSENSGKSEVLISPDIAICEDCRRELFDPEDRRYGYAFINCTNCGPRFTIIQDIPYDRPNTTMKVFPMCDHCRAEYENPLDRRYHAQPVSCFDCGPALDNPITLISDKLKQGNIVAIKGLGGYHLACLAYDDSPVIRLRALKQRGNKPFALMGTMEMIRENCHVSESEERILQSTAAPILLLRRKENSNVSKSVAPVESELPDAPKMLNRIGFMIPYTPLHLLLLEHVGQPLVMTSANNSDEPIIYKDNFDQLAKLSDVILAHDREIQIFTDDSVATVFEDDIYAFRRSRGFAPFPMDIPFISEKTVLALGPMMKTTFTFLKKDRAIMSQYISTTDSPKSLDAERKSIQHFMKIFSLEPEIIAVDKHPNYPNKMLAADFPDAQVVEVQHHKAHIASLLAENGEVGKILGISMDGTGYGDDGAIWGGEFLIGDYQAMERVGHLRYNFLPSGDKSVKEPWRFALSLLHECYGDSEWVTQFAEKFGGKGGLQLQAITRRVGGVQTSSCGRLFDGVASLLGIGHYNSFDGELPMILQTYAENYSGDNSEAYGFDINQTEKMYILDFLPTIDPLLRDENSIEEKAFRFHRTLAKGLVAMSELFREERAINKVGLSGGVFQNMVLLEMTVQLLRERGFQVLIHSEVPPNDSCISLGQALLAARIQEGE